MPNGDLNWIANFIWGIADDVLRDVYVRDKYRDVILPCQADLRCLDAHSHLGNFVFDRHPRDAVLH